MTSRGAISLLAVLMIALGFLIARGRARADGVVTDCSSDADFTAKLAAGGEITFDCGPNPVTIILNGEKTISQDTIVNGDSKVTLSGGNANRLFNITANGELVTFLNIVLTNGFANADGGAIISSADLLTFENATVENSQTDSNHSGGAVVSYGDVEALNSEFNNNKAGNGGALYVRSTGSADVELNDSSIHDNQTTLASEGWGGAVLVWDGVHLGVNGGEIYNNTALHGGAIYNQFVASSVTVQNARIHDNSAGFGGAIYDSNGMLTLANDQFSANRANGDAGALAIDTYGQATINSVLFDHNSAATGSAGALGVYDGTNTTITNSTFYANSAAAAGAIKIDGAAPTLNLTNVTLDGNDSTGSISSAALEEIAYHPHVSLMNVAIGNSGGPNCSFDDPPDTSQFNISDDDSCNFAAGQGQDNVPSLDLGPLQDNGGPTLTLLPAADSPLVDAGTGSGCPSTDQRGAPRPFGTACDVGAVEFGATPPTPTPSPTPEPTPSQAATPTPTHSPSPTPTHAPTPTPSHTPTPTPTSSGGEHWGDNDCGGTITLGDAIGVARKLVSLAVNQQPGCPILGDTSTVNGVARTWGDIDCGGTLSLGDAIGIARFLVGLPVNQQNGCPGIGDQVTVSG